MYHNAPWLSALDKQMRLQFAPKKSQADVVSEFWRWPKQQRHLEDQLRYKAEPVQRQTAVTA